MHRDLPALIRVDQLARLLGISENGVRNLITRGAIPAGKIGRQWIVRRGALLAYLRRQERALAEERGLAATLASRATQPPHGRAQAATRAPGERRNGRRRAAPPEPEPPPLRLVD
jgi:excisionase family DNA binding protein